MSDGDNATRGPRDPRGSSASDASNQWLTRSPRPSPGAAPWERRGKSDERPSSGEGHHTDGVTVADLIAKLNGDNAVPPALRRGRPEAGTPPPAPSAPP